MGASEPGHGAPATGEHERYGPGREPEPARTDGADQPAAAHTADRADHTDKSRKRTITRRRLLRTAGILGGGAAAVAIGGTATYYATRFSGSTPQTGWLALQHATALVGEDLEPVPDATVLVRDGRIVQAGAGLDVPDGAQVVDISGATVLPGLIDMHNHLSFPDIDPGEEFGLGDYPGYLWDLARYLPHVRRTLLEHGVTTIRTLGDERDLVLEMRDRIAGGELEGPRMFCAGPVLTTPGGHPIATFGVPPESDGIRLPDSPEDARRIVTELAEAEDAVDLIKVIHERGFADDPFDPHQPEVLQAIVQAAHDHGLPVTAHCGATVDMQSALDAGVDGIEHLYLRDATSTQTETRQTNALEWPEGMLAQMVDGDVTLDPTLIVVVERNAAQDPGLAPSRDRIRERLFEAHQAGVRIVAGSDAAIPGIPFGAGLIEEIEYLAGAGLGEHAALQAATAHAAQALGSDQVGVLESGRAADLLVVEGDPLRDLGALHRVRSVYRDGRLVVDHSA